MILSRIWQLCACAAEAGVSNDSETGYGEGTFLAPGHSGCSAERDVDSGVLPAAPVKGESVLLVAAQAQGGSAGTHDAEARGERASGEVCAGQRRTGSNGRRLRISKGVDEETLRAVLAAVEPSGC